MMIMDQCNQINFNITITNRDIDIWMIAMHLLMKETLNRKT